MQEQEEFPAHHKVLSNMLGEVRALIEAADAQAWRDLITRFENYGGIEEITDGEVAAIVRELVEEVEG